MLKKLLISLVIILQFTIVLTRRKGKKQVDETEEVVEKSKAQIKYEELLEMQKQSQTGVIEFDQPEQYQKFVEKSPREFHLITYFTANNCNMCAAMEIEYEKVAQFYELEGHLQNKTNPVNQQEQIPVFFTKIVFNDDFRDIFKKLDFQSVPNVVVFTPEYITATGQAKKKILQTNKWFISHTDGHVTSHKILEYINQRTGYNVEHITPLSEKIMNLVYFLISLLIIAFLIVMFYDILLSPKTWLVVSLIIYVICCSGFIYNYLHDVPLVQNGEWYSTQQRMQFGLEGYVMSIAIGFAGIILIFWNTAHKLVQDSPLLVRMLYISLFMGATLVIWFIEDIYKKKGWYNPLFHPPSTYVKGSYLKDQGNTI